MRHVSDPALSARKNIKRMRKAGAMTTATDVSPASSRNAAPTLPVQVMRGVVQRLKWASQKHDAQLERLLSIDSTIVRAHQHSAGALTDAHTGGSVE
jgi:hypothetical protein